MKALVIVESLFGNNAVVADAIAEGLRKAGLDVGCYRTSQRPILDAKLIIIGGPTHMRGLSNPGSRNLAESKGALNQVTVGLAEWIAEEEIPNNTRIITFDTSTKRTFLTGSAAKVAAKRLVRRGINAKRGKTFLVKGLAGPLIDGEIERAKKWGLQLGKSVRW